ncbi:cation-translocating P-type ATPase [bacterium]|nr:cation-translocating P-type ATPase [bacterium]
MNQKKHYIGLSKEEIIKSRQENGINIITPPPKEPLWRLFLEKFEDPIIRILLIAAFLSLGISFVHMEFAETIGIFFAILLATGVAFWFEMDANKKFDILNQTNDETPVKVIREGVIEQIPKKDVVVGDIVILETGDDVPADGELLESISMQIDESSLTGEPIIDKTVDSSKFDEEATYPSNWVMRGTKVMDGHGVAQIKSVGDRTEYGKVAQKSTEMSGEETPLNRQLDGLAKFIGVVGFGIAILTFSTLFIKDIFFGKAIFQTKQLATMGAVLISAMIALIKIWLPIIYDGFELLGKEKELPKAVKNGGWIKWMLFGVVSFGLLSATLFVLGVDISNKTSWVDIDTAGRILQYFMVAVTLIVVAVPEGLPMSVTLSLALSMRRMLLANNLVRKMHACETMGATTVICTDKTGTLTQNQMRVHETLFYLIDKNKTHPQTPSLEGALINSEKITEDDTVNNSLKNLIYEGVAINSTAHLNISNPEKIEVIGNPTEGALLLWLKERGVDYSEIRGNLEIIEQLTFSTERKYMGTVVKSVDGNKNLYIKGAPEIVLSKSNRVLTSEGVKDISEYVDEINKKLFEYQSKAMRTLGFAYRDIDSDVKERCFENGKLEQSNLIFLGVVAISDPIREEVPAAIESCFNAGIKVKIVTGDTPNTAKEIARQINLWKESDGEQNIITGPQFAALSDEEAAKRVDSLKVICRARPEDKLKLVKLLQDKKEVVAVTGDGTNDAPALNHAHVGLSMGSGTSVAKEASDITLLDDSFNSITTAVMWGRSLYQNIQRFIIFQLTINVAALIIVFLGSILGHELPLTVTQMLWVNLIMDTFAAGALASLPPESKIMNKKPRRNSDFIITPPMRVMILTVGLSFVIILLALLFYYKDGGEISRYNLSKFFTIFVMLQFWNMFNAKAFASGKSAFSNLKKSFGFIIVAFVILVGQFLIVQFGGDVFRTTPISLKDWIIIIGLTSLVLWIGEVYRFLKR